MTPVNTEGKGESNPNHSVDNHNPEDFYDSEGDNGYLPDIDESEKSYEIMDKIISKESVKNQPDVSTSKALEPIERIDIRSCGLFPLKFSRVKEYIRSQTQSKMRKRSKFNITFMVNQFSRSMIYHGIEEDKTILDLPKLSNYAHFDWTDYQNDGKAISGMVMMIDGSLDAWKSRKKHSAALSSCKMEISCVDKSYKKIIRKSLTKSSGGINYD